MAKHQEQKPSVALSLGGAFDHCPFVLFSFLTDVDAANVAQALCIRRFLSLKRCEIRRTLPFLSALSGRVSGVIRSVHYDGKVADPCMLPLLPSSVTSMSVDDPLCWRWRVSDLPRSLTRFSLRHTIGTPAPFRKSALGVDAWPPGLTSLELDIIGFPLNLPPLPSTLRIFILNEKSLAYRCFGGPCESLNLPDSLVTFRTQFLFRPVSQLPRRLTTLSIHLPWSARPRDLQSLPDTLTHLTITASRKTRHNFHHPRTVVLPPRLRYLQLWLPLHVIHSLPESLEALNTIQLTHYQRPCLRLVEGPSVQCRSRGRCICQLPPDYRALYSIR